MSEFEKQGLIIFLITVLTTIIFLVVWLFNCLWN